MCSILFTGLLWSMLSSGPSYVQFSIYDCQCITPGDCISMIPFFETAAHETEQAVMDERMNE